ncbi:hypothetical protein MTR67_003223 [Solanum verrucosum]|uniref:Uncharacterized protein n=1 Tax=Solanum verrucosum TaxID=315347 RepID=A0AAF0PRQ6_SOLVR|nr:hypothetical protein MTR67_003223 [Solanum verrucosum]
MAPHEALYERKCRSPISWFEVGGVELIGQTWFIKPCKM